MESKPWSCWDPAIPEIKGARDVESLQGGRGEGVGWADVICPPWLTRLGLASPGFLSREGKSQGYHGLQANRPPPGSMVSPTTQKAIKTP